MRPTHFVLAAILAGVSFLAMAGFDDGMAAYNKENYKSALQEWRPLAENGHANAQYRLGVMYENGNGVPKDATQAAAWFRKAAEQGLAVAQNSLGWMYVDGNDAKQAAFWFHKAAEQGLVFAQNSLGRMYAEGKGVPKDATQSAAWVRKAAEQGMASAQFNLGVMYVDGHGVPKDATQAVAWFRKAAEQGLAQAQNNLGAMYANGDGVSQNYVVAYALHNLSQAAGNTLARKSMDKNEARMSASEILVAQQLSREMTKPGNLLNALDSYVKRTPAKAQNVSREISNDPFPAQPAKRQGVISCNTNCNNGDCYRTYDSGKKVRYRAKAKFDPFSNQMTWDSGSC